MLHLLRRPRTRKPTANTGCTDKKKKPVNKQTSTKICQFFHSYSSVKNRKITIFPTQCITQLQHARFCTTNQQIHREGERIALRARRCWMRPRGDDDSPARRDCQQQKKKKTKLAAKHAGRVSAMTANHRSRRYTRQLNTTERH